jgi:hypothetical protein
MLSYPLMNAGGAGQKYIGYGGPGGGAEGPHSRQPLRANTSPTPRSNSGQEDCIRTGIKTDAKDREPIKWYPDMFAQTNKNKAAGYRSRISNEHEVGDVEVWSP